MAILFGFLCNLDGHSWKGYVALHLNVFFIVASNASFFIYYPFIQGTMCSIFVENSFSYE
jgi:hypothetical protein